MIGREIDNSLHFNSMIESNSSVAGLMPPPPSEMIKIQKYDSNLSFTDPILERLSKKRSNSLVTPLLSGSESQSDIESLNSKRGFFLKYSKHYRAESVIIANEKMNAEELNDEIEDDSPWASSLEVAASTVPGLKSSLLRKGQCADRRQRKVSFSTVEPDYSHLEKDSSSDSDAGPSRSMPFALFMKAGFRDFKKRNKSRAEKSLDTTLEELSISKDDPEKKKYEPEDKRRATFDFFDFFSKKENSSKTRIRRGTT